MGLSILAPLHAAPAVELARASRIFRKEVLRVGKIRYKGDTLTFTPDYLDALVAAHRERAFDAVPLVFAGADNAHTQDVERIRGQVLGFERDGDTLVGVIQAANDEAAALLADNPHLGVSVRIEQPIERADGRRWPAAIQHVLVTANPRITGMSPWQAVALSVSDADDDRAVLDLSTYDFADGEDDPSPTDKEAEMAPKPSPTFTDAEITRLKELLAADAQAPRTEPDGYTVPSDAELAEIAAALLADDDAADTEPETTEAPAEVAAAAEASEALELAQSRLDAQAIELSELRSERDAERFEKLRDRLAVEHGIPPRITELARPLLCGEHTVELSGGTKVNATKLITELLTEVGKHARLVDLSRETVFEHESTDETDARAARDADAAAYLSEYGLS